MKIRLADDWREWRDLRFAALKDAPEAFATTLAESQARGDEYWKRSVGPRSGSLIAERDGRAVGMAKLLFADGRAEIAGMWVEPGARGGGVGRALVEEALARARRRGVLDCWLHVVESNAAAAALYRRCGFARDGLRGRVREGSALEWVGMSVRQAPLIMGVVNVTPDSFSDGGEFLDPDAAADHGLALVADGADILDVGGEATNPRASAVPAAVELARVVPVLDRLANRIPSNIRLSIDTTKAAVARRAVEAGASIINDVAGGRFDPSMAATVRELASRRELTYLAGHLRGGSLAEVFAAEGPVPWQEVAAELRAVLSGLGAEASAEAWVDPGVGFGKGRDPAGNVALIRSAGQIATACGAPVAIGPSRKRFLRALLADPVDLAALDAASVAACLLAVDAGAAVLRVHNVALLRPALAVYTSR